MPETPDLLPPEPESTPRPDKGMSLEDYFKLLGDFSDGTPEFIKLNPEYLVGKGIDYAVDTAAEHLEGEDPNSLRAQNVHTGAKTTKKIAKDAAYTGIKGYHAKKTASNPANVPPVQGITANGVKAKAGAKDLKGRSMDNLAYGAKTMGIDTAAKFLGGDDPNSLRAKSAKFAARAAKDALDISKLVATAGTDISSWITLAKREGKTVLTLGIIATCAVLLIGYGVGKLLGQLFGDKSGGIGISSTSPFAAGSSNPEGIFLNVMSDKYNVVDPKTKRVKSTLTLEATSGGFSDERDAIRATPSNSSGVTGDDKKPIAGRACLYEGGKWLSDNGTSGIDCLASGEMYDIKTGTTRPLTDEELKWYVTGRWPYVKTYWWDQSFNTKPHTVLNPAQPQKYFMGRKVVLYNPATNRAAVGVISEWGPAPWTGVTVKERAQQRTLWTSGPAGPQPRMQVPEGYTGRVAGGGTAFTEYLGTVTDTPIVLGYLRQDLEDKTPLGPLTNFTVSKQGAVTVDGSNDSSCAELGNHSRVRYDNPGRDKGYLLAGKGQNRTGGTSPINPHMCQLLVEYLNDSDNRSVVVKVSSITSGNHSPTSRHYSGNSIDIGNEDIAPSLMQWILANQAELKKKSLMPQQVIGPQKDSQWAVDGGKGRPGFYVAEHNNHVHIGF